MMSDSRPLIANESSIGALLTGGTNGCYQAFCGGGGGWLFVWAGTSITMLLIPVRRRFAGISNTLLNLLIPRYRIVSSI